jgi:hypothetical protein
LGDFGCGKEGSKAVEACTVLRRAEFVSVVVEYLNDGVIVFTGRKAD